MKRYFLPLLLVPAFAGAQIHYTMKTLPAAQSVAVTITTDNKADKISYFLPAWVPGFYVILHHETTISNVKAMDSNGRALTIDPQSNNREWIVEDPKHSRVTFSYMVKGNDPGLGFFGVNVRNQTAFVLGGAAFMYVENRKTEPTTLKITNPAGWDTGTSMTKDADGTYKARDYDEFIDHPIDLGHFVKRQFTAEGHPFEIDFVTLDNLYPDAQADAFTARIKQLVVPAMQMFGKSPFNKYVFHLHYAVGNFSGGLEHQASVTIAIPPRSGPEAVDDLFTHEFFHAWNVKNIRPVVLGPFDYTREVRTDNLWFAEGVTDYYAKVDAYRSGLDNMNDYLFPAFTNEIRIYQGGRTRLKHTLAEASRGAWEGFSEGMGDLSYYNKGQLAGWILDAEIRKTTNGQKSLDDVMRYMYTEYHLPEKPGYPEDGILLACNKISGTDMTDLYKKLIYSTDDLPYDLLMDIGIRVTASGAQFPSLGFTTDEAGAVQDLNAAIQQQGLQTGDKIVSVGGKPYGRLIYGLSADGYDVNIRRAGEPMTIHLDPVMITADRYQAQPDPFATDEQGKRLEQWLQRPGGIK